MVFFENMKGFLGLKQASDMRLMATLCKLAEFDTGIVRVSRKVRAQICDETKISPTNINKNFKRLIDAGLITGDKGDYTINPNIFWKGTTKTRTELLQTEGLTFKITLIEPQQKG